MLTHCHNYKKIGSTIQVIRVSKRLTQEYMATKLGYNDRSSFAKIERGEYSSLDVFLLIDICRLLECNLVHLMLLAGVDIFDTSIKSYTDFLLSLNYTSNDIESIIEKINIQSMIK